MAYCWKVASEAEGSSALALWLYAPSDAFGFVPLSALAGLAHRLSLVHFGDRTSGSALYAGDDQIDGGNGGHRQVRKGILRVSAASADVQPAP